MLRLKYPNLDEAVSDTTLNKTADEGTPANEAALAGWAYVMKSEPCSQGHVAPRSVGSRKCSVCNLERLALSQALRKVQRKHK